MIKIFVQDLLIAISASWTEAAPLRYVRSVITERTSLAYLPISLNATGIGTRAIVHREEGQMSLVWVVAIEDDEIRVCMKFIAVKLGSAEDKIELFGELGCEPITVEAVRSSTSFEFTQNFVRKIHVSVNVLSDRNSLFVAH